MSQLRTQSPHPVVTRSAPPVVVVLAVMSAVIAATLPFVFGGVTILLGFGLLAHLLFLMGVLRPRPRPNRHELAGMTGALMWTIAVMYLTISDAGVMLPIFGASALAIGALAVGLARWSPLGALAALLLVGCDALILDHLTGDGLGLPWQYFIAAGIGIPGLVFAAITLSRSRPAPRRSVESLACGA